MRELTLFLAIYINNIQKGILHSSSSQLQLHLPNFYGNGFLKLKTTTSIIFHWLWLDISAVIEYLPVIINSFLYSCVVVKRSTKVSDNGVERNKTGLDQ